jgi:hypothetical protein
MKVTLFSLLAKLLPEQAEAEPREPLWEGSQSMLSLMPEEAPIANSEPDGCVSSDNTNHPRESRSILSVPIAKTQEFFKRLPFFNRVKQPLEQALTVTVEATPTVNKATYENTIDTKIDAMISNCLDEMTVKLALSKNIDDVATAFREIDQLLWKNDYVISIMICLILEFKQWEKFGYLSLSDFLSDLAAKCNVSRQAFYAAAQAGKVIRRFSGPMYEIAGNELYKSFTPAFFYGNFSKIKFLYKILFVWEIIIDDAVLLNFRDMTYREFENYMKVYEEQKKDEIKQAALWKGTIRGDPYKSKDPQPLVPESLIRKLKLNDAQVTWLRTQKLRRLVEEMAPKPPAPKEPKPPKPPKPDIPALSGQDLNIYREIRQGLTIGFVFSTDSIFVESVSRYFKDERKRKEEEVNKRYFKRSQANGDAELPSTTYTCLDWADLYPESLCKSTLYLESILIEHLAPDAIKTAFAEKFKTKSELTLVQSYLIWRIKDDAELQKSLSQYMARHNIDTRWDPIKTFFTNVLDVEESRYKYLVRISLGLGQLRSFVGNSVHFTSEGFLEKLSYLPSACKNHCWDFGYITYALNTLSAKRFREWARNKNDNLTSEPMTLKYYLKAKPFIDELHSYQAEGKSVTAIGLKPEDLEKLDWINWAKDPFHKSIWYRLPGIVWDSNVQGVDAVEPNSASRVNENECPNPPGGGVAEDDQQMVSNDSMTTVT